MHAIPLPVSPRFATDLPVELVLLPLASFVASDGVAALTTEERIRLARLRRAADAARFVDGRTLIRDLVAERTGIAPGAVVLRVDPRGRVSVAGADAPAVSLAHTAGAIVVALGPAGTRVGVDLEPLAAAEPALEAVALTPAERRAAEGSGAAPDLRAERALRAWTLKEAYAKLVGRGLALEPTAVSVERIASRPRVALRTLVATVAGVPYQVALAAWPLEALRTEVAA